MHCTRYCAAQVELSDANSSNEALQQQLQTAREEALSLQQQLVDVRQHAQDQAKELRASNAALHVS
jgi:predicted  nucleic acid-binding Zn-ribbon protein